MLLSAAGAAPCAGALILVLLSLALDVLWAGIVGVIAIAAGMAIDLQSSVQDVPYPALRDKLEAAKQIVRPESWKRPPPADKKKVAKP